MRRASPTATRTSILLLVTLGGWLGCSPEASDKGGGAKDGAVSGTGGSSSPGSGGATGSGGGSGGSSPGTGGSGSGGSSGAGGSGSGGSSSGGSSGGTGGSSGGTGGAGVDSGSGSGGASGGDAGGSPDGGGGGVMTFTQLYTSMLVPGCTGAAAGACHNVARDQYFLFADGMVDRSYMLLVPQAPVVGTIPQRVNTLLSYVTPTNPNNPNSVRMPPQSGPNLGNPPTMKPPLTAAQVAAIRAWAMGGAKK